MMTKKLHRNWFITRYVCNKSRDYGASKRVVSIIHCACAV